MLCTFAQASPTDVLHLPGILHVLRSMQVAREEWSGALWANLSIAQLTVGVEEFMRQLRKLPKEVN